MLRITILSVFIFLSGYTVSGQDIMGGEISFRYISGDKYFFDIYLYTQTSKGISHDSITFGTASISGSSTIFTGDITEWHYTADYTFPGPGNYAVSVTDSFRIANIKNVTNSSMEYLYLEAFLNISLQQGRNTSPTWFMKPIIIGKPWGTTYYNSGAYDSEGDSLAFSLVPAITNNYSFPPGAVIDPNTGLFQMPYAPGLYLIRIRIEEFRSGSQISTTYREILIDNNTVTTIAEHSSKENNFLLYPNPNGGQFTLETDGPGQAKIEIYASDGSMVYSETTGGKDRIQINLPQTLVNGIYEVVYYSGERKLSKRMILKRE